MKSLTEYLKESMQMNEEAQEKASFEFNFSDLSEKEDMIKSLEDMCTEKEISFKVDGDKFKIDITREQADADKLSGIHDVLQQYTDKIRGEQKNSSDEAYAQKTKTFATTFNAMDDFLKQVDEEDNKEEDNKEEDKKGDDENKKDDDE